MRFNVSVFFLNFNWENHLVREQDLLVINVRLSDKTVIALYMWNFGGIFYLLI